MQSGEILFDGRPMAEISPLVLANSLAYVDQDVFLFAGTVRENITLWDDSVEEARLARRACRMRRSSTRSPLRPGVYDYKLGEGGLDFSGGQRQRLEIARALVGNPAILVLDEATAALDPLVEQQIDDNIRRRGCTCIIIAHRFSTIRDCDEIVVLANGRVEGRGTHAELLAQLSALRRAAAGEYGIGDMAVDNLAALAAKSPSRRRSRSPASTPLRLDGRDGGWLVRERTGRSVRGRARRRRAEPACVIRWLDRRGRDDDRTARRPRPITVIAVGQLDTSVASLRAEDVAAWPIDQPSGTDRPLGSPYRRCRIRRYPAWPELAAEPGHPGRPRARDKDSTRRAGRVGGAARRKIVRR